MTRHIHSVIIEIDSVDDPRIASYRGVRDRDLLRGQSRFIVEGAIALERLAIASRFPVESVLLAANRVAPLATVLQALDPAVPVHVAEQAVMDAITGFHIHRGVLALASRIAPETPQQLIAKLPAGPLTLLVLIGLSNHDNVGACFRNAAALGAGAVLLDQTCCDPLYRKAIRVSSGAALSVPFVHGGDAAAILAALDQAGFARWALSPARGAPLTGLAPPPRLALVLGAEGAGLPDDIIRQCRRVSIPMASGMDSLNVAAAGAIALAHVYPRRLTV